MRLADGSIKCREVVDLSTDYLEGALGIDQAKKIDDHLEACEACRRWLGQLETVVDWAAETRAPAPSKASEQRFLQTLSRIEKQHRRPAGQPLVADSELALAGDEPQTPSSDCLQLDPPTARAYIEDRLPDEQQIGVLRHLIDGCEECARVGRQVTFPCLPDLSSDWPEARPIWFSHGGELLSLAATGTPVAPSTWISAAESDQLDLEDLVQWLVQEGRQLGNEMPELALSLSDAAVKCSMELSNESRARAAMFKGHAIRGARGAFMEADEWFEKAEQCLQNESGSGVLLAKAFELRAVSRFQQSRSEESLEYYSKAARILEEMGEWRRLGRLRLGMGGPLGEVAGPGEAVRHQLHTSFLIDFSQVPRYGLAVAQNLSLAYSELLALDRARLALHAAKEMGRRVNIGKVDVLRIEWAEGRLHIATGDLQGAVRILRGVRNEFVKLSVPSEMATVSLELSLVYLQLNDWESVGQLIAEALPVLEASALEKEELAALTILRNVIVLRMGLVSQVRSAIQTLMTAHLGSVE